MSAEKTDIKKYANAGGAALAALKKKTDPDYFKQLGRMGGRAKSRRAQIDPAFAAKVQKQNKKAAQVAAANTRRYVEAGKLVIE